MEIKIFMRRNGVLRNNLENSFRSSFKCVFKVTLYSVHPIPDGVSVSLGLVALKVDMSGGRVDAIRIRLEHPSSCGQRSPYN